MNKRALFLLTVFFSFALVSAALCAETGKLDLKVGDELYVCGCGKSCNCDTMSMKPGKCTCSKTLVKGTVVKVEEGSAVIKTDKEEKSFKTTGLYACACGPKCDCNTISQKPGKCSCGKAMKKVKAMQKQS